MIRLGFMTAAILLASLALPASYGTSPLYSPSPRAERGQGLRSSQHSISILRGVQCKWDMDDSDVLVEPCSEGMSPHESVGDGISSAPAAIAAPLPNRNGWNHTDVTVVLAAYDNRSGAVKTEYKLDDRDWASYEGAITISAEGTHTLLYRSSSDYAENAQALTIRIDKTPPEASIQFDPATRELELFGRDGISGVVPGPIPAVLVTSTGPDDWRTYEVHDLAGNLSSLLVRVSRRDTEIQATMVNVQYSTDPSIALPPNTMLIRWGIDPDGSFNEIDQQMYASKALGVNTVQSEMLGMAQVKAKFNEQTNISSIDPNTGDPRVQSSLALLEMAIYQGKLSIEF